MNYSTERRMYRANALTANVELSGHQRPARKDEK